MQEIARWYARSAGVLVTVSTDDEGYHYLRYTERGALHTARSGVYADRGYVLGLAGEFARTAGAIKIMVSPLAKADQSRAVESDLTPATFEALSYAAKWGFVEVGDGIREGTLRALAVREFVALDMDPVVKFRIRGAWPTAAGRRALTRDSMGVSA